MRQKKKKPGWVAAFRGGGVACQKLDSKKQTLVMKRKICCGSSSSALEENPEAALQKASAMKHRGGRGARRGFGIFQPIDGLVA